MNKLFIILMRIGFSERFSDEEKALFSYLEEVTLMKGATDECFNELKKYFNEQHSWRVY